MPPQIHIPQNPVRVVLLCVVCAMQGYRVSGPDGSNSSETKCVLPVLPVFLSTGGSRQAEL